MKLEENERVELKEIYIPEIKKEVIAFVNTEGGDIYVGVNNDGIVVGLEDIDETRLQLANAIRDGIKPDATLFTKLETLQEGAVKFLKLSVVEGIHKPYYLADKGMKSSGVYTRQGSASAQASESAIREMIKLSDGDRYESRRALVQDLHFEAFYAEMSRQELAHSSQQLRNLGIIQADEQYSNLALLVSDECRHSIKLAVFKGTDKKMLLNRKEWKGSIFSQMNQAFAGIDLYNETSSEFGRVLRYDHSDYPDVAIREALINAIVHRDYSFSGSIMVNIYADRMEIISLGGLVSGLSLDAIMVGASEPRNEKLAALFYRMQLIESYGMGIGKIMDSYQGQERQPIFEAVEGAMRVTLPNTRWMQKDDSSPLMAREDVPRPYAAMPETTQQGQILDYLCRHQTASRSDMEKLLDLKTTQVAGILKGMVESGSIERIGKGNQTRYQKTRS